MSKRIIFLIICLTLISSMLTTSHGQMSRPEMLQYMKVAAAKGLQDLDSVIGRWRKSIDLKNIFGYSPPYYVVSLSDVLSFLYLETGDQRYAKEAARLLASFGEYKKDYPPDFVKTRSDYRYGLPAIPDYLFNFPRYVSAYGRVSRSRTLTKEQRKAIEQNIAESCNYTMLLPEWGPMNRAIARAHGFALAAKVMPDHPDSPKWMMMAKFIGDDSWKRWEEEDAENYHAIWLYHLIGYADAIGDSSIFKSPIFRYYFDYFVHLLSPTGTIPDFGDAWWASANYLYYICLERGAAAYEDPYLKWGAKRIWEQLSYQPDTTRPSLGIAQIYVDMLRWADLNLVPKQPDWLSEEVMDDAIGKKIVFRNGWDRTSTYLNLNYRDEGDWGITPRDYLRYTIPVEEEKMHHGHADENSIVLLMSGGSVLLHDAGYRDYLPSGPYGQYRQDYYHNRVVARKNKPWQYQSVLDFCKNSGAYRQTQTEKIDFLNLKHVDMSRTRVTDEKLGYQSDRLVAYLKERDCFVVFDIVKVLMDDWFTFTDFWHTRKILSKGERWFDTEIDSIGGYAPPTNRSLLIFFLQSDSGRKDSVENIRRHAQNEKAIYQSASAYFKAGDIITFTTILVPHAKGSDVSKLLAGIKSVDVDRCRRGVGVKLEDGEKAVYVCAKTDYYSDVLTENIRPRYDYESGRVRYGDFETDGMFLYAEVSDGKVDYSATNMAKVLYSGRAIFEAPYYYFGLQPDYSKPIDGVPKWRAWEGTVKIR